LGKRFAGLIFRHGLRHGGLLAVAEHQQAGHHTVLVSASFDIYVKEIADHLGFETVICTESERSPANTITGRIDGNNCYGYEKIRRLRQYLDSHGGVAKVIAYSDHHSDQPILTWADKGIAVHPTGKLRKIVAEYSLEEISDW
jgi:HAD superfamily hydrolase (TIGR01490 family)